ncbi:MAG: DUF6443 domain-containing protein [Prevotellaceae bacterium]|jgi:hypothetical protein|nr:DUF6443 domain-containing protein [Prevotellaceae bacterium]
MKNNILNTAVFLLLSANVFAQSSGQNYIRTRTYTSADASAYLDKIDYFDGLGRAQETVLKRITPDQKDLVSFLEYDNSGREFKQWLPARIEQDNGNFVAFNGFSSAAASFYGDSRPFAETLLEASPLNRVLGQKGAGEDWENHPTNIAYASNSSREVPFFQAVGSKLKRDNFYDANTLYKTASSDEDGKTAAEFKDRLGRVVMTAQADENQTCYVYDDFGLLRYVLPPLAVENLNSNGFIEDDNSFLEQYAYIYKYDERGNQISKKLPGCEPVFMVYDKANRLVLSQDGNQRGYDASNRRWTATAYDVFGRVLYACEVVDNQDFKDLLTYYKSRTAVEKFDVSKPFGYTTDRFQNYLQNPNDYKLLTVNYYDNYSFLSLLDNDRTDGLRYISNPDYDGAYSAEMHRVGCVYVPVPAPKMLLTGTRSYILDDSGEFLATVFYYDKKGQIVQQRSTNHLQGFDIVYNKYDFVGNIEKTLKEHSTSSSTVSELYEHDYDHAGRLLKTYYTLNQNPQVVVAENSYDDLGRLVGKNRHDNADNESFEYNIKNWLTKIQSSGFEENIGYEGLYNGNISSMQWTNTGSNACTYQFEYDDLNRLTGGYIPGYRPVSEDGRLPGMSRLTFGEHFGYDKHGNIETLRRYRNAQLMDDLVLSYSGNQLQSVSDAAGGENQYYIKEYQDFANESVEMEYDANGNLIKDLDRKILSIRYNLLNLPSKIFFEDGSVILNIYAANGQKLSSYYISNLTTTLDPMENTTNTISNIAEATGTHYAGNIEYLFKQRRQDVIFGMKRIHNSEGYVADNDYYRYFYYYRRDHLGNNREVWNANTQQTVQVTNYYPSGMPWATTQEQNPDLQPYKQNGCEFIEDYGLDVTDHGNRGEYNAINRYTTMDRFCEKVPWQSPYAHAGNNPVRYVDINGDSITQELQVYVDKLTQEVNKQLNNINEQLSNENLSDKKRNNLLGQEQELNSTLSEIETLKSSTQWYGVRITDKYSTYGNEYTSDALMGTTDMGEDGIVYINLPSKTGSLTNAFVAHELKHCFQFENGQVGLGNVNGAILMYDQLDEIEAHNRGFLFGGEYMSPQDIANHTLYGRLPQRSYGYSNNTPAENLQKIANRGWSFRINGITYRPQR